MKTTLDLLVGGLHAAANKMTAAELIQLEHESLTKEHLERLGLPF